MATPTTAPLIRRAIAPAALALAATSLHADVEFIPLGHLPGGQEFFSQATSVSDNGQFVGGHIDGTAPGLTPVIWDGTTANVLDTPSGFNEGAYVNDISGDGQSAVAISPGPNGFRGIRWDSSGTPHVFDDTPFGTHTSLNTINYDGTAAGGFVNQTFFPEVESDAAIWTQSGGTQNLGDLSGGLRYANLIGVTNDGSQFVGFASDMLQRPVTWDEDNGFTVLQSVSEGSGAGSAMNIAHNGGSIVGRLEVDGTLLPAYWDDEGNASTINLWDGYEVGEAVAVSDDGSIIIGTWRETEMSSENESLAFIMNAGGDAQPLQDVLMDQYDVNLDGWTLNQITDITPDGMTMVGTGLNPEGNLEAFKIVIPAPGSIALLGVAGLAGRRRRRL